MGILHPMIIFLRQEIHRIDRVIRMVRNSLSDLQLAVDGIIILNDVSLARVRTDDACNAALVATSNP